MFMYITYTYHNGSFIHGMLYIFTNFTKNYAFRENIRNHDKLFLHCHIHVLKVLFFSRAVKFPQLLLAKPSLPLSYYRPWTQHSIVIYILMHRLLAWRNIYYICMIKNWVYTHKYTQTHKHTWLKGRNQMNKFDSHKNTIFCPINIGY